eukprot:7377398-Prymnesium_polylepis.2
MNHTTHAGTESSPVDAHDNHAIGSASTTTCPCTIEPGTICAAGAATTTACAIGADSFATIAAPAPGGSGGRAGASAWTGLRRM